MQWWTNFLDWLNSDDGWRIVSTAVIPFVAIIVAGIVAALIGRASARKVIELSEREVRASAVTALISAARKAAVWNTLPAPEQQHIDHLIGDAEIRLRLLPIAGTSLAADWARHEIAGMKRNAVSFSFQAEQSLLVFRDRLIEWQGRPGRAKKLFKNDLDSWAYDSSVSEQELVHQQQKWAAQQVNETGPINTVTTSPFARPAAPAPLEADLVESTSAASAVSAAPGVAAAPVPVVVPTAAVESMSAPVSAPHPAQADAEPARFDSAPAAVSSFAAPKSIDAAPVAAPVEPVDEPIHSLVEPEDRPRDVSEALIFSEGALGVTSHDEPNFLSEDAETPPVELQEHREHEEHHHSGDGDSNGENQQVDQNHEHQDGGDNHGHENHGHDNNGQDNNGHDDNGHDENNEHHDGGEHHDEHHDGGDNHEHHEHHDNHEHQHDEWRG